MTEPGAFHLGRTRPGQFHFRCSQMYSRLKHSKSQSRGFTLVEIMIVVGVMAIVVAIAVPSWLRARSQTRMRACQENLSKIDGAIQQLALETIMPPDATVTPAMIVSPGEKRGILYHWPTEPSGYEYLVTTVAEGPTCTSGFPGHSIDEVGTLVIANESGSGSGGS